MKSYVKHGLKLAVTAAVIIWIIHQYGWTNISSTVMRARPGWLAAGVIIFMFSVFLGACQWQIILRNKGIELPFPRVLKIYFMGIFFNNFILGIVAGDAFKVATLHLDLKKGRTSFAATFLDRMAGLIALCIFAIIGGSIIFSVNWPKVAFASRI